MSLRLTIEEIDKAPRPPAPASSIGMLAERRHLAAYLLQCRDIRNRYRVKRFSSKRGLFTNPPIKDTVPIADTLFVQVMEMSSRVLGL